MDGEEVHGEGNVWSHRVAACLQVGEQTVAEPWRNFGGTLEELWVNLQGLGGPFGTF